MGRGNLTRAHASLSALLVCAATFAQSSIESESMLHAIVGARIEAGDGRVIESGNVILRNGLIAAVGESAQVPEGAWVLDGKGLTVYPGFIDAFSSRGLKLPEPVQADAPADTTLYASASMREANRKGVRPEVHASAFLDLTPEVLKLYRDAGFTSAFLIPDGLIGGTGTLVNFSGRPARESIVLPDHGVAFGFGSGGGFGGGQRREYPGTLLGNVALIRQTLYDARWHRALESAFNAGAGVRPPSDPALTALQPVLAGTRQVYFDAPGHLPIGRALLIADEFGLRPTIVGSGEAYKAAGEVKRRGLGLIVKLNFGRDPQPSRPANVQTPGDDPGDVPDPEEKLQERIRLYQENVKNPSALAAEGLPFALSTDGARDMREFMSNLRKAVEAGLPRTEALKALTAHAAKIFGVERQLGTVEPGKIANITVMSGDFLSEKSKVTMLYIDGRRIDPEAQSAPPTPRGPRGEDHPHDGGSR